MAESNGRVYDPAIARFLSPDPLLQAPNHWLSYNRYAYCMNNPMLYTDPSGMSWFSDLWDWAKGNPLINPIAGLDWLNENIAPSVNNFLDNNNISVNAGVGYSSGNGLYTYGGNQIFYHNQQANSTEAILGRTTVTFDNGIDQRGVNFVNNLGVSKENVHIKTKDSDLIDWNQVKKFGDIAGYSSTTLGFTRIAMLKYRNTLSVHNKIGTFGRFSSTYGKLGVVSKTLGRFGYIGPAISAYVSYKSMQADEIGVGRFGYRIGSLALSIGTGASIGGPVGAVVGAGVGWGASEFEKVYDNFIHPIVLESKRQIWNFENALQYGWYPGRRRW